MGRQPATQKIWLVREPGREKTPSTQWMITFLSQCVASAPLRDAFKLKLPLVTTKDNHEPLSLSQHLSSL